MAKWTLKKLVEQIGITCHRNWENTEQDELCQGCKHYDDCMAAIYHCL